VVREHRLTGRWAAAAALTALLAFAAAGCGGGGSSETPSAFIKRILRLEIAGQWAKQWEDLNPGHQKLISQEQFVTCSRRQKTTLGTPASTITVKSVKDAPLDVRGVSEDTSKLLTVELVPTPGAAPETFHIHVVRDNGRWTWILGPDYLEALAHKKCVDGSPLPP
jgi:hypothetical protein